MIRVFVDVSVDNVFSLSRWDFTDLISEDTAIGYSYKSREFAIRVPT